MPIYDEAFDPPAPLADVDLRNPDSRLNVRGVSMLIDSGADLTLVPREAAEQIRADLTREVFELIGFDGGTSLARAVHLDLVFLDRTYRGNYLVLDRDYGILGRDILNQSALLFDGPRLVWTELRSSDRSS
jgi:hypothetical protein